MKKCGERVVNEKQILKNLEEIKRILGKEVKICAMVKANAYGHGVEQICKILRNKVEYFGVSNINEALFIKTLDNETKVLIAGKTDSFKECIEKGISFTIDDLQHFYRLLEFINAKEEQTQKKSYQHFGNDKSINIHIKIDTGMNRLGIKSIEELKEIYRQCEVYGINIEGISTHFATGDCDGEIFNKQKNKFDEFLRNIPKRQTSLTHIGGTAILVQYNKNNELKFDYDMVRIGLSLYGYGAAKFTTKIKPILKIVSRVIKIENVKKGDYIGYSKGFRCKRDMSIGVIPLGYGDGIPRNLSNNFMVEVNGQHCQCIGKICMDMLFIDISGKNVEINDEVIVMNNANEWARKLKTVSYEILTNLNLMR